MSPSKASYRVKGVGRENQSPSPFVPAACSFAAALELVVFPNEEEILSCLLREIFNDKAGFLDDILIWMR
jgi:hypothetical protein